jgi:hypothetical protein
MPQPNQIPFGAFRYRTGETIMRSKAFKAKEAEEKLTLAEGIAIIIALALLGGLTFGVVAV